MTKHELFLKAVEHTLEFEGGYVNDPVDPGGETKYGISKRAFPYLDIKNLTKAKAIEIYECHYWKGSIAERLDSENESLAMKVFDLGVQMGLTEVRKLLDKVIDRVYIFETVEILTDIAVSDLLDDLGEFNALKIIREVSTEHYENRVKENPKMKKYIKGWLRRVNS